MHQLFANMTIAMLGDSTQLLFSATGVFVSAKESKMKAKIRRATVKFSGRQPTNFEGTTFFFYLRGNFEGKPSSVGRFSTMKNPEKVFSKSGILAIHSTVPIRLASQQKSSLI